MIGDVLGPASCILRKGQVSILIPARLSLTNTELLLPQVGAVHRKLAWRRTTNKYDICQGIIFTRQNLNTCQVSSISCSHALPVNSRISAGNLEDIWALTYLNQVELNQSFYHLNISQLIQAILEWLTLVRWLVSHKLYHKHKNLTAQQCWGLLVNGASKPTNFRLLSVLSLFSVSSLSVKDALLYHLFS